MERYIAKHETEVPSMKRIGIIGGFGQRATLDVIDRMLLASVASVPQYGNRGYPPIDIRMVNKAPMKLNPDGSFPDILEPSVELLDAARFIGQNADFLIIPSNTPHLFTTEIEEASGKTFLSIVDVTIDEVVRRKCKRVGVLAIGLTLEKRLYQNPLEKLGIESVTIPDELSVELDEKGIWEIQEGADAHEVDASAHKAIGYLRSRDVDGIILGCSEIPILLEKVADEEDIINPSQLLAEAAIKKSLEV